MTIASVARKVKKVGKTTVEVRLQRVAEIPNLEFLRFEDYCRCSDGGWGYNTRADGNVSYGDMKSADCPTSAADYVGALSADDTASGEIYFYVPVASGSDYSGSTVHRANYLWFIETFGNEDWVFSAFGGYSTYAACVGLTGLLLCNEETFDAVCEALEGLDGYPVFDEEALSALESENTDSAWDSWVASDFRRAIEKKFGYAEFNWPADSDLRTFFEKCAEKSNDYWYNEGGDDSMYIDVAGVVAGVEFDELDEYVVNYVVSYNDGGEVREDYSSESEAADRVEELRSNGFGGAFYQ